MIAYPATRNSSCDLTSLFFGFTRILGQYPISYMVPSRSFCNKLKPSWGSHASILMVGWRTASERTSTKGFAAETLVFLLRSSRLPTFFGTVSDDPCCFSYWRKRQRGCSLVQSGKTPYMTRERTKVPFGLLGSSAPWCRTSLCCQFLVCRAYSVPDVSLFLQGTNRSATEMLRRSPSAVL